MNRIFLSAILWLGCLSYALAQKPPIDFAAMNNWIGVNKNVSITKDGAYVAYSIGKQSVNNLEIKPTPIAFFLQSTGDTGWKLNLPGVRGIQFSNDSRYAVFKKPGDTLCVNLLGTSKIESIVDVSSYLFSSEGWLIYENKASPGKLIICDLEKSHRYEFSFVQDFRLDNRGDKLLLYSTDEKDQTMKRLKLVDLRTGKAKGIWEGKEANQFIFSGDDKMLAFIAADGNSARQLYCLRNDMDAAKPIVADQNFENLQISKNLFFNDRDDRLFFQLSKDQSDTLPKHNGIQVDIWSYKDPLLYPQLVKLHAVSTIFLAVANLVGFPAKPANIIRLEDEKRRIPQDMQASEEKMLRNKNTRFAILENFLGTDWEYRKRASDHRPQLLRVNLNDGTLFPMKLPVEYGTKQNVMYSELSIDGKWLVYFNQKEGAWYSCNISTGHTINISKHIGASLYDAVEFDHFQPAGIAGWVEQSASVLIYSNYDIWRVDPAGITYPINMTNGYGLKHHLCFGISETMMGDKNEGDGQRSQFSVSDHSKLLLYAVDIKTKYNGFYMVDVGQRRDPKLLTMGPVHYYKLINRPYSLSASYDFLPRKALNADVWIVGRVSPNDAPNYFITHDLKSFERITNIQPQRAYNWLTTELINYKMLDGRPSQGILYKPENFDPNKKYPIIFEFRDKKSDNLYNFPAPVYNGGNADIAYFVSHGYLFFTPDIYIKVGKGGEHVINSVVAAANYLIKTRKYIDPTKMGLSGQSYDGYEVNYLITHSHEFAAAQECCGMSDLISDFGTITPFGDEKHNYELDDAYYPQGGNLWERPTNYIRNSPIFKANQVTTPLLILHNKFDPAVVFSQGIELFTALWELKKPVWLLQYDGEGHGVGNVPGTQKDFIIRLAQFFDHYLKGAPAPKWMTIGIDPWRKGIDDGLELESSNNHDSKNP